MKAARILQFGSPIVNADIPRPEPRPGQLLVRVKAAGVGPWDALIREGKSAIPHRLPLTLGSDLAGVVETMGPGCRDFKSRGGLWSYEGPVHGCLCRVRSRLSGEDSSQARGF